MEWETISVAAITAAAAVGGSGISGWVSAKNESRRLGLQIRQLEVERRDRDRDTNLRIYLDVAEVLLREIEQFRVGGAFASAMRNESVEMLNDRWMQAEPGIRHMIDRVTDTDVRRRLKRIIDSVADDDVENWWWAPTSRFREDLLDLAREVAMAASRGQELDPTTMKQLALFDQAYSMAENDKETRRKPQSADQQF